MAITFELSQAAPDFLQFILTHDGGGGNTVTIPNAGAGVDDLGGALDIALGQYSATDGVGPGTLRSIIEAGRDGFGDIAVPGALTVNQSRALMNSHNNIGATLVSFLVARAVITVLPRSGTLVWGAEAGIDGSNNPTIVVTTGGAAAATAYIRLALVHTEEM